ncbi:hypothetical protein C8J56DRAFT_785396, partial [Mycena floridula]
DIMRDNSIVKIFNGCMGIDLNIEHLIGYTKKLHTSKGVHASWEHLGNISSAIKHLIGLKKRVATEMDTVYHGNSHSTPDTSALVWRVFKDLKKTKIQTFNAHRKRTSTVVPFVNLHCKGFHTLATSSLKTFNAKMEVYKAGGGFAVEDDMMSSPNFDNLTGEASESVE